MDIPILSPTRVRYSKSIIGWLVQILFFILIIIQTGCKNKSGITEIGDSPAVTSTNPTDNADGVAVNTTVTAVFSEAMDPATITDSSFILRLDNTAVEGTINYADSVAAFSPASNLEFGSTYTATITTDAQNLSGNAMDNDYEWVFTTSDEQGKENDTTPPQITSISPEDNNNDVPVNTAIRVTFSEPMNPSTINTTTFFLARQSTEINGEVAYSNNTATLTPSDNLDFGQEYTVTISKSVEDTAGNTLSDDFKWGFTTSERPDETAPQITNTDPSDNENGVSISSTVTVTFSESINTSTINSSTFYVEQGGTKISGTYSFSGNSATFAPSNSLSYESTYTATVTTGVEDLAGNNLSSNREWSFTTGNEPDNDSPVLESTEPGNSQQDVDITTNISANFNEAINQGTVNSSTFFLELNGSRISGTYNTSGDIATFNPSSNLSYETTYTATLTTGIEDLAGNGLESNETWTFTTEEEPDLTPPELTSRSPQPGSNDIAIGTNITATFNESIDRSTVNNNTFILRQGSTQIFATYNFSGNTLILNPSGDLSYETTYSVTLTTGIEDLAGNGLENNIQWNFTTEEAPDLTPPSVTGRNPNDNASDVPINTSVSATFSETIDESTVNNSTFILEQGSTEITGSYNTSGNTATFTPSGDLSYETTYTATLTTGIEDLAGNGLESIETWTFTTEEEPDLTAPEVDSTDPDNGETDVPVDINQISVTFTEPMNSATFDETSFILTQGGSQVNGSVPGFTGSTASFIPDNDLATGTDYTVTITTDVEDLAGNNLQNQYQWTFTTELESIPPTLEFTSPDDKETGVQVDIVITASFSEDLDPATVNNTNVTVSLDGGGTISGDVDNSTDLSVITFTPLTNLQYESTYNVTITTGIQDLAGNALPSVEEWSFTTVAETITN